MPRQVKTETHLIAHANPDTVERYKAAKARRDRAANKRMRQYYADPVAFAHDCIAWPDEQGTASYQDEVLAALPIEKRVAQRGPHGLGKSTDNALALLWFALTRDAAGIDWKCATTAGGWHQLEQFLWPEVHKWAARLRWDRIGREPFNRGQLLQMGLKLRHGAAFAAASTDPARLEGAHADSLLFIYDEAKIISTDTFNASEGAFAGATNGREAFALASSTPGEPSGRFYDIHTQKPGLTMWWTKHVTVEEAMAAGRVSADWVEQMADLWGPTSGLYANRVLGEFHSADEDAVIPLAWAEAAVERWHARDVVAEPVTVERIGVDVARSGTDKTVLALRGGSRINELRYSFHEDTMQTTGRVGGILLAVPGSVAVVDTDGLGAGVTDRLREQGHNAVAFHAGQKTANRDRSRELGFVNVRAAAWWNLREQLDPSTGSTIELPPDDTLLSDLCAPHWKIASNSRIQIEAKDEIKKRLGRSTDAADAVVQAFWEEQRRGRRMVHAGLARDDDTDEDKA